MGENVEYKFYLTLLWFFLGSFKKREREREEIIVKKKKRERENGREREREDKRPIIKEW